MKYLLLALALGVMVQDRPWMRCEPPGCPEISCASPHAIEQFRKDNPGRRIDACECQHTCDPTNEYAEETDGRGWDPRCRAACSPASCTCDHPCES